METKFREPQWLNGQLQKFSSIKERYPEMRDMYGDDVPGVMAPTGKQRGFIRSLLNQLGMDLYEMGYDHDKTELLSIVEASEVIDELTQLKDSRKQDRSYNRSLW